MDDAAVATAELRAATETTGRAPPPPKGHPGKPIEGGGGKVHAAVASMAKAGSTTKSGTARRFADGRIRWFNLARPRNELKD
nr:unnamed protein product [Digitaria exilis]